MQAEMYIYSNIVAYVCVCVLTWSYENPAALNLQRPISRMHKVAFKDWSKSLAGDTHGLYIRTYVCWHLCDDVCFLYLFS